VAGPAVQRGDADGPRRGEGRGDRSR
jgi:hypothetical protein